MKHLILLTVLFCNILIAFGQELRITPGNDFSESGIYYATINETSSDNVGIFISGLPSPQYSN